MYPTKQLCPPIRLTSGFASTPRQAVDVDENDILQVATHDKATGSKDEIIIPNVRGVLTQEVIDRMVREAEEYEEEDGKVRELTTVWSFMPTTCGIKTMLRRSFQTNWMRMTRIP